jgi:hypothetical protein
MATFTFELVFTGMCLLEFDNDPPTKCTVHIPNAARPDVVFSGIPAERCPFRHVPRLSFPTKFQVLGGRTPKRLVDRVFPAPDGEEIGVCNLEGETLTLQPPDGSPSLSLLAVKTAPDVAPRVEELFSWTSDLQDLVTLSNCTFKGINASAVATQVNFAHGRLGTFECGRQNGGIVVYDYDQVKGNPKAKTRGRSLADAVVLRLQGLEDSVALKSAAGDLFFFPQRPVLGGEVVRVCISNFHERPEHNRNGLFDFLWYYNVLDGLTVQGRKPDPLELFIPYIPENGYGPVTGSSGHCPPTKILSPKTEAPIIARLGNSEAQAKIIHSSATVEGELTSEGEFPASVALIGANGSLAGSGILLDGEIVLTAGHVLDENPVAVVVGRSLDGARQPLRPGFSRTPPDFDGGNLKGDLLLLRLATAVNSAVPTRASTSEIDQSKEIIVVGFGFGNQSGPDGTQRKSKPPLKVLHATCPRRDPSGCYEGKELVTDERGFGGVFSRDSGAPAFVDSSAGLKLAAITSRTVDGDHGIYVRLDVYASWIAAASAELKRIP